MCLTLFTLLSAASAAAQDAAAAPGHLGAPGVEIISSTWRRESRSPRLNEDPLLVAESQGSLQDAQRRAIQENNARAKAAAKLDPVRIPTQAGTAAGAPARHPNAGYVHRVKVRNTGTKTISRLVWRYATPDAGAGPAEWSRPYEGDVKVRPGQTKRLTVRALSPPFNTVSATQAGTAAGGQPAERLVMVRVEYDDGTVWVRPVP